MNQPETTSPRAHHVHLIGIGGIGMSYLARWFLSQGWTVSGSDLSGSPLTQELAAERVGVAVGPHKATSLPPGTNLVIRSQAITVTNPEYLAARKIGVQIYSLPEMVGILTREHTTIAVSGAHGKSTTTALIGLILMEADYDPTIMVGTKLRELGGKNFRLGGNASAAEKNNPLVLRDGEQFDKKSTALKYLVLEADEYGRAFHEYTPSIAVVTNIDAEHLDIYTNLAGVKKAFLKYFDNLTQGGLFVLNLDDANLASLSEKIEEIAKAKDATIIWYSIEGEAELAAKIKKVIKIPGAHNVSNALAAVHVAEYLGINRETVLRALSKFEGTWRRMEYKGEAKFDGFPAPVPVYDDYAHHPTEIRASLAGLRDKYPEHAIICVFQPHQAKRLEALFKEFQSAFETADIAMIAPIYKVFGRDEKEDKTYNSETLVKLMQEKYPGHSIFYLSDLEKNLKPALQILLSSPIVCGPDATGKPINKPAVIVMMGAGNIVDCTESLMR
ncbi:MAG: Mur ligase family protein [Candidatus Liptonbacteria bacterium]